MRKLATVCRLFPLIVAVVAPLVLPIETSALTDSPTTRAAQADRYLKAMPPREMFEDLAEQMSQNMPPEQALTFRAAMMKDVDIAALEKAMKAAMIKNFTASELSALADFYGSAVGKSAMTKFRPYMADLMPALQAEMLKLQAKMAQEAPPADEK
jgi:hypothetical protein